MGEKISVKQNKIRYWYDSISRWDAAPADGVNQNINAPPANNPTEYELEEQYVGELDRECLEVEPTRASSTLRVASSFLGKEKTGVIGGIAGSRCVFPYVDDLVLKFADRRLSSANRPGMNGDDATMLPGYGAGWIAG
jgi:hypothetical protein